MKELRVTCDPEGRLLRIPIEELHILQGKLKEMSKEDYEKFKELVTVDGINFALHVWKERILVEGTTLLKWWLVDGTGRKLMFSQMRDKEGFSIPALPCVEIFAKSLEEAKQQVLSASSTFHKMTPQGLHEYIEGIGLPVAKLEERYTLPHVDLPKFKREFYDDAAPTDKELELYTKKITAPIYEPKGEKPELVQLFQVEKTGKLLEEIENADAPEDVKNFLRLAAQRHTVFDYEKIAEYYAQAPKVVQNLMERSALVIIDFKQAIENGFVRMSEDLAKAYRE